MARSTAGIISRNKNANTLISFICRELRSVQRPVPSACEPSNKLQAFPGTPSMNWLIRRASASRSPPGKGPCRVEAHSLQPSAADNWRVMHGMTVPLVNWRQPRQRRYRCTSTPVGTNTESVRPKSISGRKASGTHHEPCGSGRSPSCWRTAQRAKRNGLAAASHQVAGFSACCETIEPGPKIAGTAADVQNDKWSG